MLENQAFSDYEKKVKDTPFLIDRPRTLCYKGHTNNGADSMCGYYTKEQVETARENIRQAWPSGTKFHMAVFPAGKKTVRVILTPVNGEPEPQYGAMWGVAVSRYGSNTVQLRPPADVPNVRNWIKQQINHAIWCQLPGNYKFITCK